MLNKKSLLLALSTTMALGVGNAAHAEKHIGPNLNAEVTLGVLKVEDRDTDLHAFESNIGFGGLYAYDSGIKIKYDVVADLAGKINDFDSPSQGDDPAWTSGQVDDIYIRDARMIVISKLGAVMVAPRITAGHWEQLYGTVDIFEYNRFHPGTDEISVFGQKEQGKDTLAYATPEFLGGLKLYLASIMLDNQNDEDVDTYAARLMYNNGGLKLGVGHTTVKQEQLPTGDDYSYNTATAAYDFGHVKIAATYEMNSDSVTLIQPPTQTSPPVLEGRDYDSFVAVASYDFLPNWSVSAGYANKSHDLAKEDVEGQIANFKYRLNDSDYLFAEAGQYDNAPDNISAGVHMSF